MQGEDPHHWFPNPASPKRLRENPEQRAFNCKPGQPQAYCSPVPTGHSLCCGSRRAAPARAGLPGPVAKAPSNASPAPRPGSISSGGTTAGTSVAKPTPPHSTVPPSCSQPRGSGSGHPDLPPHVPWPTLGAEGSEGSAALAGGCRAVSDTLDPQASTRSMLQDQTPSKGDGVRALGCQPGTAPALFPALPQPAAGRRVSRVPTGRNSVPRPATPAPETWGILAHLLGERPAGPPTGPGLGEAVERSLRRKVSSG